MPWDAYCRVCWKKDAKPDAALDRNRLWKEDRQDAVSDSPCSDDESSSSVSADSQLTPGALDNEDSDGSLDVE